MNRHVPVLLNETVAALQLAPGMRVIDATLGDAGHAEAMLKATAPDGKLLGIDVDPEGLLRAKQFLYQYGDRVIFARDNFSELERIVARENFRGVAAILFDLGWSTPQFADRGRGFSFQADEPLDMRYGTDFKTPIFELRNPTAADLVNQLEPSALEALLREWGEEPLSKEIAAAIITARQVTPIATTGQLVEIILDTYRKKLQTDKEVPWVGGLHPTTKVFQALRMAVNNELEVIKQALPQALKVLEAGGRLAVISFHSLEDRIVKHYFKSQADKTLRIITKKPIVCSEEEYNNNPPSRSAKLRVVEKI